MKAYAKTTLEVSVERATQIYQWEGYGLSLHVPKGTKANFTLKAVSSKKFKLPEGTELVSAVYWVSCEGKVGGPVGIEMQHYARVRQEGMCSCLSFAISKPKLPYRFELCEGQFRSGSNYGRMEMSFSDLILTTVKRIEVEMPLAFVKKLLHWGRDTVTADPKFQAMLYYELLQQSTIVHFVIVPYLHTFQVSGRFVSWLREVL